MPIIASDAGGDFKPCPEGMYAAVCTQILDLGIQETQYGMKHKVRIAWEVDEQMDDGRPYLVSQMFTLSLNEKAALRKMLEGWRNKRFTKEEVKGFDIEKLLGVGCMVSIVHSEDGQYANVNTVTPLPKGMSKPDPVGPLLVYSCDDPDPAVLEKLPEKLGDRITTGLHRLREQNGTAYSDQQKATASALELDDEIPF